MNKVVFITGISTGFGKATSALLAEEGFLVYGTCRKSCEHHPKVHVLTLDVTSQEGVEQSIREVIEKEGRIDILINNAGMHTGGAAETAPLEDIRLQMETNFMGPVHTMRAVLPYMRKQGYGLIINVSSIGGLMGLPFQGYYSASKFALEGISEAFRKELKSFNVQVVLVNPGDFHTNNTLNRKNIFSNRGIESYKKQFEASLKIIEHDETHGREPIVLANKILQIIRKKKPAARYVVATFDQKLAVCLKRMLPDRWFDAILLGHYGMK